MHDAEGVFNRVLTTAPQGINSVVGQSHLPGMIPPIEGRRARRAVIHGNDRATPPRRRIYMLAALTSGLTMNATEMSRWMSGMGGPPPQGRGGPDQLIEDAAKAIGISKADQPTQLKSGASIADVAKAAAVALNPDHADE